MVITECAKFSTRGLFRSYLSQPTNDDPREQTADLAMGTMVYRPDGATINAGATDAGKALDVSPEHFHAEFHETGRAACFWVDVCEDKNATPHSPQQRMERLISQALVPVVQALEATGEINGKLIWSNTGYLINWYLTEMKQLLGEATVESLRHALFFEKTLTNGEDNPLWRTVVLRDGLLVRRTCCQRYRLPDVQQCGDCTLK